MARNEEKQLARLNRFYLQQQKEDELKKRPPRPKLETLNSVEDVKKWLPTILRDIDFYVRQMEVPCYPDKQIEEFERRIDHHRGEYKAFIRKLHQLEPDLKTTPWSDRQYVSKRKKIETGQTFRENGTTSPERQSGITDTIPSNSVTLKNFTPLSTPVLATDGLYQHCYGFKKPTLPNMFESQIQMQNEPLQFNFNERSVDCVQHVSSTSKLHSNQQVDCHQLEFNDSTSESRACTETCADFSTDSCQPKTDLRLKVPLVNPHMINLEHPVKCSSCTAQLYSRTDNDTNSCKDCKCESGAIVDSAWPTASLVSSSNEKIIGVSLYGTLNIPYTDSSSSDGET